MVSDGRFGDKLKKVHQPSVVHTNSGGFAMTQSRNKNIKWTIHDAERTTEQVRLCVDMDIRDALLQIVQLLQCYRIPRALDAVIDLGKVARRKRRPRKVKS